MAIPDPKSLDHHTYLDIAPEYQKLNFQDWRSKLFYNKNEMSSVFLFLYTTLEICQSTY